MPKVNFLAIILLILYQFIIKIDLFFFVVFSGLSTSGFFVVAGNRSLVKPSAFIMINKSYPLMQMVWYCMTMKSSLHFASFVVYLREIRLDLIELQLCLFFNREGLDPDHFYTRSTRAVYGIYTAFTWPSLTNRISRNL